MAFDPNAPLRARTQDEHRAINAQHYPGTRQLCSQCDSPTGRCEEDSMHAGDDGEIGPLCEDCYKEMIPNA